MKEVVNAEWYPAEDWAKDPKRYSAHAAQVRKGKDRRKTAFVQRLFVAAWAILTAVLILAVIVK